MSPHVMCFWRHSYKMEDSHTFCDRRRNKSLLHKPTEMWGFFLYNNFGILYSETLADHQFSHERGTAKSRGRRGFAILGLQRRFSGYGVWNWAFWDVHMERLRTLWGGWVWLGGKGLSQEGCIKPSGCHRGLILSSGLQTFLILVPYEENILGKYL